MSRLGLSALAVRVTGIVIAIYAVRHAGFYYIAAVDKAVQDSWMWVVLTPLVMMVTASICMIFFPRIVAGNLVPPELERDEGAQITTLDMEILACSLIGLYFLVQSISDILYYCALWISGRQYGFGWVWSADTIARMIATAAEFFAAVWLLFGARGLVDIMRWVRRARPGNNGKHSIN